MATSVFARGSSEGVTLDGALTDLVVLQRKDLAEGVVAITLAAPSGAPLPPWTPGAHLAVVLGNGLVRQYSLCGDPADTSQWRFAVLREPAGRGGSSWIHEHLESGQRLSVRGPRNHFELEPAKRYIFVAGGIGITPILPMIDAACHAGAEWTLTYGGRSRSSMAFLPELARYGDHVRIQPQDEVGLLNLRELLGEPTADTLVYCCGPEPLLGAMEAACASWDGDALRVERFASAGPVAADPGARSIRVELRRSGVTVMVPPGRSILEVVNEAGANVMCSCEEGICGTCETVVLEGVPDHRDQVLTAAERRAGESMMLCVSRAHTDHLVLDI